MLWKDILYGSEKQLFWYCDPYYRTCVDMDQGGAIVDLDHMQPMEIPVGIGGNVHDHISIPYAIHTDGYFTHYAGEGSIKSCKVSYKGEEADLCLCRTKAKFSEEGNDRILTLDPVDIEFSDLTFKVTTRFIFSEGSSEIKISRIITDMSNPDAKVHINEYITACYGTTEYPEDMNGIVLRCRGKEEEKEIVYAYKCREESVKDAAAVEAVVPQVKTKMTVYPVKGTFEGYFRRVTHFHPCLPLV